MLRVNELTGFGAGGAGIQTLLGHLTDLGLLTGLKLCLDAGDALSAPASATSWLDRSGNGYDFFLGTTAASQTTDPTFNGVVGGISVNEYWSFDGGDFFVYDTTNETWMQNIHKNNAKYTLMAWVWINAISGAQHIVATCPDGSSAVVGVKWRVTGTGRNNISIINGSGGGTSISMSMTSAASVPTGRWCFIAVTYDEVTGDGAVIVDDIVETLNRIYDPAPSSGSASDTMRLAAGGDNADALGSGSRMAELAAWEGVTLTVDQVTAIYSATRTRFGV